MAGEDRSTDRPQAKQRVDKWLFFARIMKSRSLAAKAIELGRVRINSERAASPAASIKAGDVLTVTLDRRIGVYRVLDIGERRGPAPEARTLYEDLSPPAATQAPPDDIAPLKQARRTD